MLEPDNSDTTRTTQQSDATPGVTADPGPAPDAPRQRAPRKAAAKKAPAAKKAAAKKSPASGGTPKGAKKAAASEGTPGGAKNAPAESAPAEDARAETPAPAKKAAAKKAPAKKAPAKKAAAEQTAAEQTAAEPAAPAAPAKATRKRTRTKPADEPEQPAGPTAAPAVVFVAPEDQPTRRRRAAKAPAGPPPASSGSEPAPGEVDLGVAEEAEDATAEPEDVREAAVEQASGARRRRRRGRRGRGGSRAEGDASDNPDADEQDEQPPQKSGADADADDADQSDDEAGEGGGTHRRRRRRRSGGGGADNADNADGAENTGADAAGGGRSGGGGGRAGGGGRGGKGRGGGGGDSSADSDDGVRGVKGSTRLEAKRQRRREGRDTGRRRPPILSESEFLARREAVDRVMAVRQNGERTQIAVLEDDVLVEHYVTRASATSYVGNVYLGRVQNVLPSMEAAFVDIGKGRNGVLYAGEVNWEAAGLEGKSRNIETALSSGDVILVQVTKDPIGHKGARLTSQVSLPGRFLVYVPGGGMTGISRKLPDTERHRLKAILKKIVPEDAGVIIRTAAEGASEEELTRDVERLKAQWEAIDKKSKNTKSAPTLVHGEPDLAIRVVRDVFNEDFKKLIVEGEQVWQTVSEYVGGVAPDLAERVTRHTADTDLFHDLRVDEQLMKALDRKVWLPSGGSLVIDRTEAMTVIDVNTGKFVGTGGNLEQTVTRNNLEAAEEIVRQLRLRDVGGIVVIDFIDMVLESNRELVLRRLTECLGRDRTKHQVAEVTSLGLVQMTRKRVGEGLLEAFSEQCPTCNGRGVLVHGEPVDKQSGGPSTDEDAPPKSRRKRGSKKAAEPEEDPEDPIAREQRLAAMAAIHAAARNGDEPPTELEVAAAAAVLDAEPTDLDVAVDAVLDAAAETEAEPGPEVEPETVAVTEPEPPADAEPAAEPEPIRPARPRRRRAASRPAGPPGGPDGAEAEPVQGVLPT